MDKLIEWQTDALFYWKKLVGVAPIQEREKLLHFWLSPNKSNQPEYYVQEAQRSEFLVSLVKRYLTPKGSILEVGCNVGRNLEYLRRAGYTHLSGIELNPAALATMKKSFPVLAKSADIHKGRVEDVLPTMKKQQVDLTYTMAVLEHIHPDSEDIFAEMTRVTKQVLITIENERHLHWRSQPRDYHKVFTSLGWEQVECVRCTRIEELGPTYFARVFRKGTTS